jgi:hypothetical protein
MTTVASRLHATYIRSSALGEEITQLFGWITAATYDLLVKIREFDQEGLWKLEGVCSCAHWLNWKCGIGMNAGREKVRVANALGDLPKVSEAFRLGEISYSKVRAITRVATPENEDYLLMIARHGTAHNVETLVSGYRRAERLNDNEVAEQQFHNRTLNYRWGEDGSLVFNGRLPAEVGALLLKALDSAVDSAARDEDASKDDWEPIATRRADALAEMAESYLASGAAESSSADRYHVMLHVTAVTPDEKSTCIEDGPHVAAVTSRRIGCDSSITRLIEDDKGEPLSIGRNSRVIPPPIRRALKARDKHCRFPGCTHRYRIDGHHIEHWADGGETCLDNLVQLCRFHHRLVHEGGFVCEKHEDGRIVFRNALGELINAAGHRPPANEDNGVINLKDRLEERHIHAQTCVTRWHGEKMDRDLAVAHLCALTDRQDTDCGHPLE